MVDCRRKVVFVGRLPQDSDQGEMQNGVSLLVSLLIRYPEVFAVNYEPRTKNLKFTFMVGSVLSDGMFRTFEATVRDSLEAFWDLSDVNAMYVGLEKTTYDDLTVMEVERDVCSLTSDEISLIMELIRVAFMDNIICEGNTVVCDEDIGFQNELIDNMLDDIRESRYDKNLVGYRDGGKVLVFDKTAHDSRS
jgi:hypothetical protein